MKAPSNSHLFTRSHFDLSPRPKMTGPPPGGSKVIIGGSKIFWKMLSDLSKHSIFFQKFYFPLLCTFDPPQEGAVIWTCLSIKCDLCDIMRAAELACLVNKVHDFHLSAPTILFYGSGTARTFRLALYFSNFFSQKWPKNIVNLGIFPIFGLRVHSSLLQYELTSLYRTHYMGNTWMHHCVQKISKQFQNLLWFWSLLWKKIGKIKCRVKSAERVPDPYLLLVLLCHPIILYCADLVFVRVWHRSKTRQCFFFLVSIDYFLA